MKMRTVLGTAALLTFSLTFAGCGGGGGSGTTTGPTVSRGVITALGSIFVNGIEYNTTGTSVSVDNSTGSATDLKEGKVVTVNGTIDDSSHGTATSVDYRDNLEGPVDTAPDLASNRFQALGQTIQVNTTATTVAAGKTVFSNFSSLSQLAASSLVEASGLPDANGVIQASYIELKGSLTPTTDIELKGTVSSLNTIAKTFKLGLLTVNYASATLSDMPAGGLANGMYVEASGTGAGYTGGAAPSLAATKVDASSETMSGSEGEHMEVAGFVTGFTAGSATFNVGGQPVNAGSLSLSGIANNVRVEVEGTMSGGVLMLTKISIS